MVLAFQADQTPRYDVLCDKCGSVEVVRSRSRVIDKVVRFFTGRKPFVCRRCGWRGRRHWEARARPKRGGMAAADPSITVLDQAQQGAAANSDS
jgi:predicted RNA-binding Zn-ribbon protein involved in translation (DUF1610 family)